MRKSCFGLLLSGILIVFLSGCAGGLISSPSTTPTSIPPTNTPLPPTSTLTPTLPPSATPTSTQTSTPTETPTPSASPLPTATPGVLRGKVLPEKLSCRYGPGVMYLYKYGVLQETVMEIIGRMDTSSWVLVQAIGGDNACWVNGDYMEIRGEVGYVDAVDPHVVMAWSPYYEALTGISARRDGDEVTVFWDPLYLRAGDSSEQVPYVVEAWVCQNGDIVFDPVGAYSTAAVIVDEAGCAQESYARIFAAEKHGYTQWFMVDIPPHPDNN